MLNKLGGKKGRYSVLSCDLVFVRGRSHLKCDPLFVWGILFGGSRRDLLLKCNPLFVWGRRAHLLKYDPAFVWGIWGWRLFGGKKRGSFSVLKCDHAIELQLSQIQFGF